MRMRVHTASLLALAACSGGSSSVVGTPGTDAGATGSSVSDAAGGSGSIDGSIGGTPFGGAAASLWIGAPDDPATTVVYLFSKPVACSDLATPGWDTRIADGTQMLEMKMFGTSPATYNVVTTQTPAPGEAAVNYTLSATSGTPMEQAEAAEPSRWRGPARVPRDRLLRTRLRDIERSQERSTPPSAPEATSHEEDRLCGRRARSRSSRCSSSNSGTTTARRRNELATPEAATAGVVPADLRDVERDGEGLVSTTFGDYPDRARTGRVPRACSRC